MIRNMHQASSWRIAVGQRRQVDARRPPALMSQPAPVLLRHGARAEIGQAHPGRDRLPQDPQEPGLVAGVPAGPVPGTSPLTGQPPAPAPSGEAASHPAVSAFQSAAARSSASSVTCPYMFSVVCTSAWPSRRLTTCTGTPASSKAEAWLCLNQCGVQPAGTCPASWRRSRRTRS